MCIIQEDLLRWNIDSNTLEPATTGNLPFICQISCDDKTTEPKQTQPKVTVADKGAQWVAIVVLCLEVLVGMGMELVNYMLRPRIGRNADAEQVQHLYFVQVNQFAHFHVDVNEDVE